MPIATKAEVKSILQIAEAVTTYDSFITALIPLIQDFIVFDHCKNDFRIDNIYVLSSDISFVSSSKKIIDSVNAPFVDAAFYAGMDILVVGSYHNDGIYSIATSGLAAGELTLNESLIDEDENQFIEIYKVKFPAALKRTVAKMIQYDMNKKNFEGIASESLGSHSISFSGNYPQTLLDELNAYRKVSW
jgi:Protein of unknown function (DUF2742).